MSVDNETKIIERLDKVVDRLDKLVEAVPKPASRTRRMVELVVTTATVLGVVSAIDIIVKWIGG
jgi:transposase